MISFISCDLLSIATGKPIREPDVVFENNPIPEEKDEVETVEEVEEKDNNRSIFDLGKEVVEFHGVEYKVSPHKNEFNIALILPFYYNAQNSRERLTSNIMVEYYQGVLLALEELEERGFKAKLIVYDDQNDTNKLKDILAKREFEEVDLIIGPILESHMNIVGRYALENGVPAISPFTAITELEETNPLLYSTVPGYKLRASLVVDYLEKYHRNEKLIILRDGKSLDKAFVPYLIEELDTRGTINYMREAYDVHNRWNVLLTSDSGNVVYIPSYSAGVVNSSISGIFAAKKEVTILGESVWADFEDNDFKFWEKTNVHLIASDFVNTSDTNVKLFKMRYREINNEDPSTYSFMGYDQMSFVGDFLMAFGEHFPLFISERGFKYLSARYHFVYQNGCNENKTLFILQYHNNVLKPIE